MDRHRFSEKVWCAAMSEVLVCVRVPMRMRVRVCVRVKVR